MHCRGYRTVRDLAVLNNGELPLALLQASDLTLLRALIQEIRNCLGTDQDPLLPVKNTFINFPAVEDAKRPINSCPVFHAPSERSLPPGLPSIGSMDHTRSGCKPCAWFYHPDGCRHGLNCEFCHICPDGELKKRKKEKQSMLKFLRKSNAAATSSPKAKLGLPPSTPMALVSTSTTPSTASPQKRNTWLDAILRKHF